MKFLYAGVLSALVGVTPLTTSSCDETDADGDGYTVESGEDCDDSNPTVYSGAQEVCDGVDNDCDGEVDENVLRTFYTDADGDGYGTGEGIQGCEMPAGYATTDGDCFDFDNSVHPGALETPGDALDSNCNDTLDVVGTVAGTGSAGYSGDGGLAESAQLNRPYDMVLDSRGNLLIADATNHRVRKIDTNGIITTFAGNGVAGSYGDNGAAASAQLNYPRGLAVDAQGQVYIADSSNHKIRKVDLYGKITTFAGNGTAGFGGDGGSATAASLAYPYSIAVDASGRVFIADSNNHRIRMVSAGIISTYGGNGTAAFAGDGGPATAGSFYYPRGLALLGSDLFIADTNNQRIRLIRADGTLTTVVGSGVDGYAGDGGPALQAALNDPYGVTVAADGVIYVADTNNHRIRRVANGTIQTVLGSGVPGYSGDGLEAGALRAQINLPYNARLLASDTMVVAEGANAIIREVVW